jgi:hypothetical protein
MEKKTGESELRDRKGKMEIRDEMNQPEIKDEDLDRVTGGGNSVWGTVPVQPGG